MATKMTREEAINKVRQMNLPKETMEILEALVPELAESEDEFLKSMNLVYKAIRKTLASLAVYAEDEELLDSREETLSYYSQRYAEEILKSLKPSWKPSEWQMSMLLAVIRDPNNAGSESCSLALKSIYEQLEKLM